MFKSLLVLSISLVCAQAYSHAPTSHAYGGSSNQHNLGAGQSSQTLKYTNDANGDGNYNFAYDTSNGISAQEHGLGSHQANGGFSYTSPEGQQIHLTYTADENGFHPSGDHLPTPPPIPEAILKSLEFIRTHPSQDAESVQHNNHHLYDHQQRQHNY